MLSQPGVITELLHKVRNGDSLAKQALAELLYQELRKIARAKLSAERPGHTLTPTALVNEAWLRFDGLRGSESKAHFLATAATAMRRVLIDHARERNALKRQRGNRIDIAQIDLPSPESAGELLALDEALDEFAEIDPRAAQIIEMRYFAGLSHTEIGEVLNIDRRTVDRDWKTARAWLFDRLRNTQKEQSKTSAQLPFGDKQ